MNGFRKVNSVVVAVSLFLQVFCCDIMAEGDDPTDSSIVNSLKEHFHKKSKDLDGASVRPITYPDDMPEKKCYIMRNGTIVEGDRVLDPENFEDHRLIKFYNIPELLREDSKINVVSGQKPGYVSIKFLLDSYISGMKVANEILHELRHMDNDEERMKKFSAEFYSKLKTDPELMHNASEMACRMGVTEEIAAQTYSMIIVSKKMAEEFAENAELKDSFTGKFKRFVSGVASSKVVQYTAGGVTGVAYSLTAPAVGAFIGTTVFPGLGTAVGGIIGGALGILLSGITGVTIGYIGGKAEKYKEKFDSIDDNSLIKGVQSVCVTLGLQKAANYASILNQMMVYLTLPEYEKKILNSNIFVTAVDDRNFFDSTDSKNFKLSGKLMHTPDQGAWCDFKYISDLENAPQAQHYSTSVGRTVKDLITIFRAANVHGKVNFDELKSYLCGWKVPAQLKALNLSLVNFIKGLKKSNIPKEGIINIVSNMEFGDALSREEILEVMEKLESEEGTL